MKSNIIIIILLMAPQLFGTRLKANAAYSTPIEDAYEQYAAIDKALTNEDPLGAKKAAGRLIANLNKIEDADAAIRAAAGITQSQDIKEQRQSFAELTVAMHNLFKSEKPAKMLYIHYCPMAKAYWMDEEKTIHNPYFGKSMSSCGKTTGMVM